MKKKLLILSLLCVLVITFVTVAVGCRGGGISRGGGGGQPVATQAEWEEVIDNTSSQADRHDRNWVWTEEIRISGRIDGGNRINQHTQIRTVRNGDRVQQASTFWELSGGEFGDGGQRTYNIIRMDGHGFFRDAGTTSWWNPPPRPVVIASYAWLLTREYGFDNFDFVSGRLVLNTNRWIASLRESWYSGRDNEWRANNPFVSPLVRRDNLTVEITVINGLISNVFASMYNNANNATSERRITVDWDRRVNIRTPRITEGPPAGDNYFWFWFWD